MAKIAMFLPSLRGGGAERVMVWLSSGFVERGIDVDLVLAKAEGPLLSEVSKKVRIVDLSSKRVSYSLPKLVRYLRVEKPDVLLSTIVHANVISILAKKISHVNTKIVVRHTASLHGMKNAKSGLKFKLTIILAKMFYKEADLVIANSVVMASEIAELFNVPKEKLVTIYNPIPNEIFTRASEPVLDEWFTKDSSPVILSVGRLTKQKDFETLIRAFRIVRKIKEAKLVILGEGEERTKLEELAKDLGVDSDIYMPGFTDNPFKYMRNASVFVLSSRYEGLPNVLIETLALGVPVVATDCPTGPREILENGKYGYLVPVGDEKRLAEAIIRVLDGMKPQVDKAWLAKFSYERIIEEYLNVLLE